MKRTSLTKSGSTATPISITNVTSGTFVPPYQPFNSSLLSNRLHSSEITNTNNTPQETKRNNSSNIDSVQNQTNSILKFKDNGVYSTSQPSLQLNNIHPFSSQNNKTEHISSHNPLQANQQSILQQNTSTFNNNNSSKQLSENNFISNQKSVNSTQKTFSLQSNSSQSIYPTPFGENNNTNLKFPLNHTSGINKGQLTPLQNKVSAGAVSPKLKFASSNISGSKNNGQISHSNLPATTYNENGTSNQKFQREYRSDIIIKKINMNKADNLIKQNFGIQQNTQYIQNNNKEVDQNSMLQYKNNNIISQILQQNNQKQQRKNILSESQQNQLISKNQHDKSNANLDSSVLSGNINVRNSKISNLSHGMNVLSQNQSNNNSCNINHLKSSNQNIEIQNMYANQPSTDRSFPKTPKSPANISAVNFLSSNLKMNESNQSSSNLQFLLNTTAQTQFTEIEGPNNTDAYQQMNISSLSANTNYNLSTNNNLTERNVTQPDQTMNHFQSTDKYELTNKENYIYKCKNHPEKKAKYVIYHPQLNENHIYCSKCAIQYSKEGFKPIHIQDLSNESQIQALQIQPQHPKQQTQIHQCYDLQEDQFEGGEMIQPTDNEKKLKQNQIFSFLYDLNQFEKFINRREMVRAKICFANKKD